jgi:hypothetical protein
MKSALQSLTVQAERIRVRHGRLRLLGNWLAFLGGVLLFAAMDAFLLTLREGFSFFLCLALIAALAFGVIQVLRKQKRRDPFDQRSLAARVEAAFPKLNDLVTTAADLHHKGNPGHNPLEAAVLAEAEEQLDALPWEFDCTRRTETPQFLTGATIALLVLTAAAFSTPFAGKAMAFGKDLVNGSFSGILVTPELAEVARGSDLEISIRIERWQNRATIEFTRADGASERQPVVTNSERSGKFTFYGVEEPLTYRILTPSLRSPRYTVSVYDPPTLDAISIEVIPPEYTGLPAFTLKALDDIRAPEGARLNLSVQSQAARKGHWILGPRQLPLTRAGETETTFTASHTAAETLDWRIELESAPGRNLATHPRQLVVIPDEPPVVEIILPQRDQTLPPGQVFPLSAFAADDYGLTAGSVTFSLSGRRTTTVELGFVPSEDGVLTEGQYQGQFDLDLLGAENGDLLTIYVTVTDNREPDPQSTRTDVVFFEIRAEKDPEMAMGSGAEAEELDLRILISELKRLLRETYRTQLLPEQEAIPRLKNLSREMDALYREIQKTYKGLEESLISADLTEVIRAFTTTLDSVREATRDLADGNTDSAITRQEFALSLLLRLEDFFRQNIQSEEPSEGSGSGQGETAEQPSEPSEPDPSELESMRESLQELAELIRQQNALNASFSNAQGSGWSEEEAEQAAGGQEEALADLESIQDEFRFARGAGELREALANAASEMRGAAAAARESDPSAALRGGLRAGDALRQAAVALQQRMAETATRAVASVAEQTEALSENQSEAASQSESAARGQSGSPSSASLEANQRDLNATLQELMELMQGQASDIANQNSQAAEALQEALRQLNEQQVEASMERAANALLYGQTGTAAGIQQRSAMELAAVARLLQESAERLQQAQPTDAEDLFRQLRRSLDLNRKSATPPEGYRSEVEEYFRRLVTEP